MRILAISEAGFSSDLFFRMEAEGHQVKMWIMAPKFKNVYDGLLDKVSKWQDAVTWADLIVFDHTGMSNIWKQVRDIKPCFGGSAFADKLEKDRPFAHQIFKQIGLKSFESIQTKTIEEAIKHVKDHHVEHVIKPVGKKVDSHHVIISEDKSGEDAVALLESFMEQGLEVDYLEIEERKKGIEVGVSGWYISDGNGDGNWSGDININFEHKRFASGYPEGVGPLTGETGTAMKYESQENELFRRTLDKIKPILAQNDYRGQIDISFIITDDGEFPLEATPRLGYPACMIEQSLQRNSYADLFMATARRDSGFVNKVSNDWAVGVVCMMPGFPSNEEVDKRSFGIPVFGLDKSGLKDIHLVEVETGKNMNGKMNIVTTHGIGYPMVVTGTGKTIQDARSRAYHVISNVNPNRVRIPNMYYRNDIGDRVIRQQKDFERLGILSRERVDA